MNQVIVHKGRTNIVTVSLGFNVSADTFRSQIRVEKDPKSELLAEWDVSFVTDGADGELELTIQPVDIAEVDISTGYMDLLRITGGVSLAVFDEPLQVIFRDTVTV